MEIVVHPVLDFDRLRHLSHGDDTLVRELLAGFECECMIHVPRLARALSEPDRDAIARVAPRLRASCTTFGAVAMAALLHEIERWHSVPEARFGEWIARLETVWRQLHSELRTAQFEEAA